MAAATDLTFQELQDAFISIGIEVAFTVDSYGNIVGVNLPGILEKEASGVKLTDGGVVKFAVKLLEACRVAQEAVNAGKTPGEKLVAFPAATTGGVTTGFVPVTRSVQGRYELSSATRIVGSSG